MEEQGAGIYDYEFCTVYTSINTALWVTIFAITIIILSRNLNFKRKYCFNVLWALVVLCLLRFFLNFEIPFFTYNLRSYTILVKIREIFRYNFYTYCYEDDIGKIYYYFTLGRLMEVIYLATTIVLLIKKSLRCRQLYRIVNLMNCTDNIEILNALKIAKQKVGVRKNVGIIVNKNIRTPVIIGYFKPVIILPVVELSEIQLITVLSHELIHYKYKHIFIKLLVEIICVVMWWNPVFYFFRKEVFNILEFYTDRELMTIILRSARVLGVEIEESGAMELARRSRGTPRLANRLLKRVRDFAQVKYDGVITEKVANYALDLLDVDKYGLDHIDRSILLTMIEKFQGGPVGLDTLAASISEDAGTLEDVYEPYLLKNGFIQRTPRGRVVTALAYSHLGIPQPQ